MTQKKAVMISISVLLIMLLSSSVFALFESIRGSSTGIPLYDQHKELIDFGLAFTLFIAIAIFAISHIQEPERRRPIKIVAVVIGIILAISAFTSGFSATFLSPFMKQVLFFFLVAGVTYAFIRFFNIEGAGGRIFALLLAAALIWLLFNAVNMSFGNDDMFRSSEVGFTDKAVRWGKGLFGSPVRGLRDRDLIGGEEETKKEICSDGKDNDDDGDVDCADSECKGKKGPSGKTCPVPKGAIGKTLDGIGNFFKGLVPDKVMEIVQGKKEKKERTCDDGRDNDGDGDVDCADKDCDGRKGDGGACQFGKETLCVDGFDNDDEQGADCSDPDCKGEGFCSADGTESSIIGGCKDTKDNDADGLIDCQDPDCISAATNCEQGKETLCHDDMDNDGDGKKDCDDTDCDGKPGKNGGLCAKGKEAEVCNDGIDNDGDTKADCADSDCDGKTGQGGGTCTLGKKETACKDGTDNDGDGKGDCADSDCTADKACKAPPSRPTPAPKSSGISIWTWLLIGVGLLAAVFATYKLFTRRRGGTAQRYAPPPPPPDDEEDDRWG